MKITLFLPKNRGGSGRAGLSGPPFPCSDWGFVTRFPMTDSCTTDIRFMAVDQLGQRYRRYRLPDPDAEKQGAKAPLPPEDHS